MNVYIDFRKVMCNWSRFLVCNYSSFKQDCSLCLRSLQVEIILGRNLVLPLYQWYMHHHADDYQWRTLWTIFSIATVLLWRWCPSHSLMLRKHETLEIRLILTPLNPAYLCSLPPAAHPILLDWTLSKGKLHQCSGLTGHPCCWPEVEPVQKVSSSSFANRKHIINHAYYKY